MAGDIQKLAEELANLNKNSTLWAQPQMTPQLQSYANATPGVLAPSMLGGNQVNMNYALQQQYNLNPFRAQAYGGQFNSMMPGAEYATSSRMGIYRESAVHADVASRGQHSFWDDLLTSYHFKSYAGYEDPYLASMQATQRMEERKGHVMSGAVELGGVAASFLPWGTIAGGGTALTGAAGFAVGAASLGAGLVAAPLISGTIEGYYDRRNEAARIQNVMRDLVTGVGVSGGYGQGVSADKAAGMMLSMRAESAKNPHKTMEDYMDVFETGAASGLFNFEGDATSIISKVKKATKMVDTIMLLAGDATIQSAVQRMSKFQAMGVDFNSLESNMTNIKASALMAGTTFEDVMNRGGSIGAQQAQLIGASTSMGMQLGAAAYGTVNRFLQGNEVNAAEATARGNKSGMTQRLVSQQTNDIHAFLSSRAGVFMNDDGELSSGNLEDLVKGKTGNSINKAISKAYKMGLTTYRANAEDTVVNAEAMIAKDPFLRQQLLTTMYKERAQSLNMSMDDMFDTMGPAGKLARYSVQEDRYSDILVTQRRAQDAKMSQKREKVISAGRAWNVLATKYNKFTNEMMSSLGYESRLRDEEIKATIQSGGVYREATSDIFRGMQVSDTEYASWKPKDTTEPSTFIKSKFTPELNAMFSSYGEEETQRFVNNLKEAKKVAAGYSSDYYISGTQQAELLSKTKNVNSSGILGKIGSGMANAMDSTFGTHFNQVDPSILNKLSTKELADYLWMANEGKLPSASILKDITEADTDILNYKEQMRRGEKYFKLKTRLMDMTKVVQRGIDISGYHDSEESVRKYGFEGETAGDFQLNTEYKYFTGGSNLQRAGKAYSRFLQSGASSELIDKVYNAKNDDKVIKDLTPEQRGYAKELANVTSPAWKALRKEHVFDMMHEKNKIDASFKHDMQSLAAKILTPDVGLFDTKESIINRTKERTEYIEAMQSGGKEAQEALAKSLEKAATISAKAAQDSREEMLKKGSTSQKNLVLVSDIRGAVMNIETKLATADTAEKNNKSILGGNGEK